jgi:hypothetical protein
MNRIRPLAFYSIAILIACASSASAWNPAGHMAIARAAFEQLDASRQRQLVAILRQHPRFAEDFQAAMPADLSSQEQDRWIFERAATWPDLARNLPTQEQLKYNRPGWHYIDLPVYLDDEARQKIKLPPVDFEYPTPVHDPNLNAVQALKKNVAEFNDPKTPDPQKAVALCWILHLTGDIHQPLHGAALFSAGRFRQLPMGDKGGNDIPVKETHGMIQAPSKPNLHSLWDAMLGTDVSPSAVRSLADEIVSSHPKSALAESLKDTKIEDWSQESNAAAIKYVYTPEVLELVKSNESHPHMMLPTFDVTDAYLAQAKPAAQDRAALAAYRTAWLLAD